MNLLNIFIIFLLILLIIILIIHIIYFVFNNSSYVNLKKNQRIDDIKYINCNPKDIKNNLIKEIYLTYSKTRFTNNYNNFITHYDVLLKDINENLYLICAVTKKIRTLNIYFISNKEIKKYCNNDMIKIDKENYYINPNKYETNVLLKDFIDLYRLNEYGYHIFYSNCHHKIKSLINILSDDKIFEVKKYTLDYCIKKLLNSIYNQDKNCY